MSLFDIVYTILIQPLQLIFEVIFTIANRFLGHPGLSIIVLSLIMNFLVLPLYRRADIMQEKQRDTEEKLKAGVEHIKKTFSGDERMMMLQTYYKQNNYKPTSALNGSVSLLLEIPFFIAAYQFLSHLPTLSGVSLGPIRDLGVPDAMFVIGGFTVNVLPILMTLINVVASAIYLKGFPVKTKVQLYALAAFFLVFLYTSPSGLVFYWTLNNLFSLVKNCFYKFKRPGLVLCWLSAVAGVGALVFGLFFYNAPSTKKYVFVLLCGAALLLPLLISFVKGRLNRKERPAPVPQKKVFVIGGLLLAVIVGLFIPSTFLQASPQEFVNVAYFHHPLWYLVSSFGVSVGVFCVWFGVFYWLASPAGKVLFEKIVWIAAGVMLVNYMFFGTNLGILLPTLQYQHGVHFSVSEQALNLGVIVLVAAVFCFVIIKFPRIVSGVLGTALLALGAMSGVHMFRIHTSVAKVEEQAAEYVAQQPHFTLSKDGKNVVFIMLDRAMGEYVPYIFNELPELKEQYKGFTYYSNTISYSGNTNFTVPSLFGGYEYTPLELNRRENELLKDKHNEALLVLPVLFSQNDYDVTVFDPPYANYEWISDLSIYEGYEGVDAYLAEGVVGSNESPRAAIDNNHRNFFFFGLMKAMPLFAQETIYELGNYNKAPGSVEEEVYSYQVMDSTSTASGLRTSFMNSYNVLKSLPEISKIEDGEQNTFFCMASQITHEWQLLQKPDYTPSMNVDNTAYDTNFDELYTLDGITLKMDTDSGVSQYHSNVAAYKLLAAWFDYLKENGVWDNTKIVLVADHGGAMTQIDELNLMGEEYNVFRDVEGFFPLLMVKDFGATEDFRTSTEFMTNADVPTILTDGTIENPVNPFTNKPINNDTKFEEKQYIFTSNDWDIMANNGYQFIPSHWATVHTNIWDANNWEFIEYNTTDPTK